MELLSVPDRDPQSHELDAWAKDWRYESPTVLAHRDGLRLRFEPQEGSRPDSQKWLADIEDGTADLVVQVWMRRGFDVQAIHRGRVVQALFKQGVLLFRLRPHAVESANGSNER